MKIKHLHVENFFSIGSIDLDMDRPGLNLVLGANHDNGAFKSNGAAKSALFEAIVWCLFGQLMRDVSLDSIVRRGASHAAVEVLLDPEDGGEVVRVTRVRAPKGKPVSSINIVTAAGNQLFPANSVRDVQSDLDNWLGLDYQTFTNSVFFGKGLTRFFMAATDAERKDLLDTVLQVVSFDDALARAKDRHKALEARATTIKQDVAIKEERRSSQEKIRLHLQQLNDTAKAEVVAKTEAALLEQRQLEHDVEKIQKEQRLNEGILGDCLRMRDGATGDVDAQQTREYAASMKQESAAIEEAENKATEQWRQQLEDVKASLTGLSREQMEWEQLSKLAQQELMALGITQGTAQQQYAAAARKQEQYANISPGATCPTCLQDITEDHAALVQLEMQRQVDEARGVVASAKKSYQDYEADMMSEVERVGLDIKARQRAVDEQQRAIALAMGNGKREVRDTIHQKFEKERQDMLARFRKLTQDAQKTWQVQIDAANVKATDIAARLAVALRECNRVTMDLKAWRSAKTYDAEIQQVTHELEMLDADLTAIREEGSGLHDRIDRTAFWVEAFGPRGIRSFIFETALPYLTDRANVYSAWLTGGTVVIDISPTTTAKTTGNTKEKLNVVALNQHGSSVYQGNSDGERRRIDICILLALRDLIATRASRVWNTLVFDEIFDALDEVGIDNVIGVFRRLSNASVYVISHSSDLKQHFDDAILVKKQDGISTLAEVA